MAIKQVVSKKGTKSAVKQKTVKKTVQKRASVKSVKIIKKVRSTVKQAKKHVAVTSKPKVTELRTEVGTFAEKVAKYVKEAAQPAIKTSKKVAKKDLKDLKQSVLNQLNEMNDPTGKKSGRVDIWFKIATAAAVVLLVLLLIFGDRAMGPADTLSQIRQAVRQNDVESFERYVDITKLSQAVVDQMLETPTLDAASVPSDMKNQLGNNLQKRMTDVVKPGLSKILSQDIRLYVKTGTLVETEDVQYGLLTDLWRSVSEEQPLLYRGVKNVVAADGRASLAVQVDRPDIGLSSLVELTLQKYDDIWKVVSIDNLGAVLNDVETARKVYMETKYERELALMKETLVVEKIKKSSGLSDYGSGKGVLLTLAVKNVGGADIESFVANVAFTDAAGQLMKEFTISDNDGIAAEGVLEKTWTLLVNPEISMEKHIYSLPQASMRIEVTPRKLVFKNGKTLGGMY